MAVIRARMINVDHRFHKFRLKLATEESAMGIDYEGYERTIDAHIKNLRQKLSSCRSSRCHVETVRSVGYKLEVDADAH